MLQQELVAGTTLNFPTTVPGYPASEGWVLKYHLRPRSGSGSIDLTAIAEGDDYRVQETATNTASWTPGTYGWESRVTLGAEVFTVAYGDIVIRANVASVTGSFDNRSQAERALDDAKAAFADFNTSGGAKKRYRIGDREVEYSDRAQIVQAINFWSLEVQRERRCKALAQGRPDPGKVYVRINRE